MHKALSLLRCELELSKIQLQQAPSTTPTNPSSIRWNGKATELIELIYALHHNQSFGDAKLKDLFSLFESIFDIKMPRYSHNFGRFRVREGNRCRFLYKIMCNLATVMELKD